MAANQYVFEINKDSTLGKQTYCIEENNFFNALLNIQTMGGLKLFLFLSKNKDKFRWVFFRDYFMSMTGMNTNTVSNAIKELKEIGYLIPISKSGYHCLFFDNLDKAKEVAMKMKQDNKQ